MKAAKITKPSLRLRRNEPLPKGIRRIAQSQIAAACHALEGNEPTAVHEARKALKKLRAILALVSPVFSRTAYCEEKRLFQQAARLLSPLRDAEVRLEALDTLLQSGDFEPADFACVREPLAAAKKQLMREADTPKRRARKLLQQARDHIQNWPLDSLNWKCLAKKIRQCYRKGRKALASHHHKQTPQSFHTWRKRAKELWYDLRITEALLPKAAAKQIALCDEVGTCAGSARDLTLLGTTLFSQAAEAETARLLNEIEIRHAKLQHAALRRGERLYAKKPGGWLL